MSRILAPVMRNGFPVAIPENVPEWDGTTYFYWKYDGDGKIIAGDESDFVGLAPSSSSDYYAPVRGEAASYPIGVSFEKLVRWFYRVGTFRWDFAAGVTAFLDIGGDGFISQSETVLLMAGQWVRFAADTSDVGASATSVFSGYGGFTYPVVYPPPNPFYVMPYPVLKGDDGKFYPLMYLQAIFDPHSGLGGIFTSDPGVSPPTPTAINFDEEPLNIYRTSGDGSTVTMGDVTAHKFFKYVDLYDEDTGDRLA